MRRTKEEAEITRKNILDAAEELFCSEGFEGASLARIGEAAGVKRGAVHFHFTNKAGILVALADRELVTLLELYDRLAEGTELDPLTALSNLLVETLHGFATNPRRLAICRAMIWADFTLHPDDPGRTELLAFDDRLYRAMHGIVSDAAKRGQLGVPWAIDTAAMVLHTFMCGLITSWSKTRTPERDLAVDGIDAVRELVESFRARRAAE